MMTPNKTVLVALAVSCFWAASMSATRGGTLEGRPLRLLQVVETTPAEERFEDAVLVRPVSLAFNGHLLLVADAQDCAVKVFSDDGRFVRSIGRKGAGPGEFSFPSGVCWLDGRICVADKFNYRIQILDASGKPESGFRVGFAPDKVHAAGAGMILVTSNPTGRPVPEKMLHLFDKEGKLLWEGLETRVSGDPVYDSFKNMILVCPAGTAGFYVIFRSGERSILHFGASGELLDRIAVDDRYSFKTVRLPFKGPQKSLMGFCWSAAFDRGRFYLLEPEPVEERDLGPGRRVHVFGRGGRREAVIDLPRPVHRFVIDDGRIYAIDEEGELAVFEVVT